MKQLITALILAVTAATAQAQDTGGLWGWIKEHSCGGKIRCSDPDPSWKRPIDSGLSETTKSQIEENAKFFKGQTEKQETQMSYNECRATIAGVPKTAIHHSMDLVTSYSESFFTEKYKVRMMCGAGKMVMEKELREQGSDVAKNFLK